MTKHTTKKWENTEIRYFTHLKMASQETIPSFYVCSPLYWVFFVCKKQQYQGEIALVTNLRPLTSEQLLKFGYILYCFNGEYIS